MRFRVFIFILFANFSFCFSQSADSSAVVVESKVVLADRKDMISTDSALQKNYWTNNEVFPKKFKSNYRNSYKGEDFNYTEIKPHESLWERIKRRLKKFLESIFGEMDPYKASNYAKLVARTLGIAIIGFLLYFLIKYLVSKDGNFFFSKNNKKINIPEGDIHENIHEINFTETISKFEREKDFRSAVRYRFLQILKNLSDRKLIDWNIEKTNRDYAKELSTVAQKQNFRELAYIFDYVWYGEFRIDENDYQYFKNKFENSKF